MGYRTDERAVNALLDREFRYFGLLGYKTRISKLFDGFRAVGICTAAGGIAVRIAAAISPRQKRGLRSRRAFD
jgi:hypothetical protein